MGRIVRTESVSVALYPWPPELCRGSWQASVHVCWVDGQSPASLDGDEGSN